MRKGITRYVIGVSVPPLGCCLNSALETMTAHFRLVELVRANAIYSSGCRNKFQLLPQENKLMVKKSHVLRDLSN